MPSVSLCARARVVSRIPRWQPPRDTLESWHLSEATAVPIQSPTLNLKLPLRRFPLSFRCGASRTWEDAAVKIPIISLTFRNKLGFFFLFILASRHLRPFQAGAHVFCFTHQRIYEKPEISAAAPLVMGC